MSRCHFVTCRPVTLARYHFVVLSRCVRKLQLKSAVIVTTEFRPMQTEFDLQRVEIRSEIKVAYC